MSLLIQYPVSSSRTMHPQSYALTIGGTALKESDHLDILGVTFDSKMPFEKHLRSVFRAASQRLGILRKSWDVFHDRLLLGRCFRGFFLPVLEYRSVVWCSAADIHLKLLDRVISGASFLTGVCLSVTLLIVDPWQYYVLLLLLLLKEVGNARLGESDWHPISPKTPTPQHQPIERKKRKGKQ